MCTLENEYGMKSMAVLPRSELALCSRDGEVCVFDLDIGTESSDTIVKCCNLPTYLDYEPERSGMSISHIVALDGNKLAWIDSDNCDVNVLDITSGALLHTLVGHTECVHYLLELPFGKLASCSDDDTVRIWCIESGKCLFELIGHTDTVYTLAVFPSGELASGADDGTVRIWNTMTGKCLLKIDLPSRATTLAVLPDGKLVSGCDNGMIYIWEISTI